MLKNAVWSGSDVWGLQVFNRYVCFDSISCLIRLGRKAVLGTADLRCSCCASLVRCWWVAAKPRWRLSQLPSQPFRSPSPERSGLPRPTPTTPPRRCHAHRTSVSFFVTPSHTTLARWTSRLHLRLPLFAASIKELTHQP